MPRLSSPPPVPAVLPLIVQSVSVTVPGCTARRRCVALPPAIVRPGDRRRRPGLHLQHPAGAAAGDRQAGRRAGDGIGPPLPGSTSGPAVSVMVWAVAKAVESKVIEAAADRMSARSIAPRRSSSPEGAPAPSVATPTTSGSGRGLEGADVHRRVEREPALIGRHPADRGALADGGAAGKQGHGLRRPAVVAQRGQAQAGEPVSTMSPPEPFVIPPDPPVPTRSLVPMTLLALSPPMSLRAALPPVLPATIVSVRVVLAS